MSIVPLVIESIVANDLCVGCGVCVAQCPSGALVMDWNSQGFLQPKLKDICNADGECLKVCPFNFEPEASVRTEDEISALFLNQSNQSSEKIGRYINLYAGFASKFRLTSSSGGLATFVLSELLSRGEVQHVVSVKEASGKNHFFEYGVHSCKEDLLRASKTRYFPVTLSEVLSQVKLLEGKVAVTGVPCFVKALRLAQNRDLVLRAKIGFIVGIICGGLKSRFYTDFLAENMGVKPDNVKGPSYRVKDLMSTASDYSFACEDGATNLRKELKMRPLGDMWGTGLFKANACDYCDDVATELADISLGDAWVEPFEKDGAGTSVVVTRTLLAERIIKDGLAKGELCLEEITEEVFVHTQRGSYNHRHNGLGYRMKLARKKGLLLPPKRRDGYSLSVFFKLVQLQRMRLRRISLSYYGKRESTQRFIKRIARERQLLKLLTRFYHYHMRMVSLWNRMCSNTFKNNEEC